MITSSVVIRWLVALAVVSVPVSFAVAQDGRGPEFAVASIKALVPGAPTMTGTTVYPDGRLIIRGAAVKPIVATAFGLPLWQVSGGDAWTQSELYSIEAKPPEEMRSKIRSLRTTWTGIEDDMLRSMLQALLIERFRLQVHRETRAGTVYVLKQSGKPLRLRARAAAGADTPSASSSVATAGYAGGQWTIGGMSMRELAEFASNYYLQAPVFDQTGLLGAFDYRQAQPDIDPNYTNTGNSFYRMIDDVGLRLDRTDGQVETLVIDSVQRPSAN